MCFPSPIFNHRNIMRSDENTAVTTSKLATMLRFQHATFVHNYIMFLAHFKNKNMFPEFPWKMTLEQQLCDNM